MHKVYSVSFLHDDGTCRALKCSPFGIVNTVSVLLPRNQNATTSKGLGSRAREHLSSRFRF